MKFINSTLGVDENIVMEVNFHWIITASHIVGILITLIISVFFYPFLIIGGVFMGYQILKVRCTEMAITSNRVIIKRGIISRKTEQMPLKKVEEVNLRQGIVARIFGWFNVNVVGTGGSNVNLKLVADGLEVQKSINTLIC